MARGAHHARIQKSLIWREAWERSPKRQPRIIFQAGPAFMKRQSALPMGSLVSGLGSFFVTTDLGAATDLDFLTRLFWVSSSGTGRY